MTLQEQVITIEQAKRLKELGVAQEAFFYWSDFNGCKETHVLCCRLRQGLYDDQTGDFDKMFFTADYRLETTYAAFTVAELGVMMSIGDGIFTVRSSSGKWVVNNVYDEDPMGKDADFKTEAQARAAMLIHLLETNLITADEVNARLNPSHP